MPRPECGYARLFLLDVRRLRPLRSLRHLERDLVPFLQALESVPDDRAVVDEHVRSARALDEAEPLRLVEPLHLSCLSHANDLRPLGIESARKPRRRSRPGTRTRRARSTAGARETPHRDPRDFPGIPSRVSGTHNRREARARTPRAPARARSGAAGAPAWPRRRS